MLLLLSSVLGNAPNGQSQNLKSSRKDNKLMSPNSSINMSHQRILPNGLIDNSYSVPGYAKKSSRGSSNSKTLASSGQQKREQPRQRQQSVNSRRSSPEVEQTKRRRTRVNSAVRQRKLSQSGQQTKPRLTTQKRNTSSKGT